MPTVCTASASKFCYKKWMRRGSDSIRFAYGRAGARARNVELYNGEPMKKLFMMGMLVISVSLVLAACGGNPDENAARATVGNFERTMEDVIAGKAKLAALDDYFATAAEGANAEGLVNTHDAFVSMVTDHVSGASLVELSNFRITNAQVHQSGGLASVTYQVDVKIVHGTQQGTATRTQDLALLKTPRGWRISGGDPWRYSNVVGTLP